MCEDSLRLRERSCPACGGEGRYVAEHTDPAVASYGLPAEAVPLRLCEACGMRFYDLVEGVNTAGEIYMRLRLSGGEETRHRTFVRLVQSGNTRSGGQVLDLGAGASPLGRLLPSTFTVTAVDRQPNAAGAPPHLRFVSAEIATLDGEQFTPGSFDWVILDNVLEHLPAFEHLLACTSRWLGRQGRLLVVVPNGRTLKRLWSAHHRREVHRPIEHVNIFEGATLDVALARAGFVRRRPVLWPRSVFEAAVAISLFTWAPFGLYRVYALK